MKKLLIAAILATAAKATGGKVPDLTMFKLMTTYNAYKASGAAPAYKVIPEILKASKAYNVSSVLILKILLVESAGKAMAVNKRTADHGIMQINHRTAVYLNLSKVCVLDISCSINAAVAYLKTIQLRKNYRHCMYNIGPNGLKRGKIKACLSYERKLANIKVLGGNYEQAKK